MSKDIEDKNIYTKEKAIISVNFSFHLKEEDISPLAKPEGPAVWNQYVILDVVTCFIKYIPGIFISST